MEKENLKTTREKTNLQLCYIDFSNNLQDVLIEEEIFEYNQHLWLEEEEHIKVIPMIGAGRPPTEKSTAGRNSLLNKNKKKVVKRKHNLVQSITNNQANSKCH
ncbi:unnamed protein product [Macrosiphum euphorbiae]|uniref:Uncharacterized protein n=1 Tax=Macrosiphum euphorbiae TaxID=13131 RepID=A0AAV0W9Q6_9HEMI|nr:unnamed protein product [Macrosiphum euphorbiae]